MADRKRGRNTSEYQVVRSHYFNLVLNFENVLPQLTAKCFERNLISTNDKDALDNTREPLFDRSRALLDSILQRIETDCEWYTVLLEILHDFPELERIRDELNDERILTSLRSRKLSKSRHSSDRSRRYTHLGVLIGEESIPDSASTSDPQVVPPSPLSAPTLSELVTPISLPGGETFNVAQEVGTKYMQLCVSLLNDDTGSIAESLVREHSNNVEDINRDIFKRWLQGEGLPVSWTTLIGALEDIELNRLAEKIKENIKKIDKELSMRHKRLEEQVSEQDDIIENLREKEAEKKMTIEKLKAEQVRNEEKIARIQREYKDQIADLQMNINELKQKDKDALIKLEMAKTRLIEAELSKEKEMNELRNKYHQQEKLVLTQKEKELAEEKTKRAQEAMDYEKKERRNVEERAREEEAQRIEEREKVALSTTSKPDYPRVAFSKHIAKKRLTSDGGEIEGEGGINLLIPEGAIQGEDEVEISLQACVGGPFKLPNDNNFVSPVYLIEPQYVFHKPVILSIHLFASLKTEDDYKGIYFVTSPTKYQSNEKNEDVYWRFREYGSPTFSGNHGKVALQHFCLCCFGSRGDQELMYSAILWHPTLFTPPQSHLIFTITISHGVYVENLQRDVEKNYKNEEFRYIPKNITFHERRAYFTLPKYVHGCFVNPDITPCEISWKEVNLPKMNRTFADLFLYPPRIAITIRQCENEAGEIEFPLKLEGINEKVVFNVSLASNPITIAGSESSGGNTSSSHLTSEGFSFRGSQASEQHQQGCPFGVSRPRLLEVQSSSIVTPSPQSPPPHVYPVLENKIDMRTMDLLKWKEPPESGTTQRLYLIRDMSPKWRKIGSLIGLTEPQLESWEMKNRDPEACMKSVIGAWMERSNEEYPPTWNGLLELLEDVELNDLRENILRAAASKNGKLYGKWLCT